MNTTTLFKFQSLVATLVFTLSFSLAASAQTATTTTGASEALGKMYAEQCNTPEKRQTQDCKDQLRNIRGDSGAATGGTCQSALASYKTAAALRPTGSAGSIEEMLTCEYNEGEGGDYLDSDIEDEKASGGGSCAEYLNSEGCSKLNGGLGEDAEEKLAKYQKEVNDLQTEKQRDAERNQQQQFKLQQALRGTERTKETLLKDYQTNTMALEDKLKDSKSSMAAQARQLIQAFRAELVKKQNELIDLDAALDQAELAISSAKIQKQAKCRGAADQNLKEAQKLLTMTKEKRKVERRNYAMSSLSGAGKRRTSQDRKELQLSYANTYKNCMDGVDGVGSEADSAIQLAVAAYEKAKLRTSDRKAVLENDVKLIKQKFEDDQATLADQADSLTRKVTIDAKKLADTLDRDLKTANDAASDAQTQLNMLIANSQKNEQITAQSLGTAQGMLQMAQARYNCTSKFKGTTDAALKYRESMDKAGEYSVAILEACNDVRSTCTSDPLGKNALRSCEAPIGVPKSAVQQAYGTSAE